MQITILMPCLNESETIAICIHKAQSWLNKSKLSGEILIADNGSNDGSQAIATNLGCRVIDVKEKGYGSALFHGCLNAKGRWILMADSDDSYDFSNLDAFILKLNDHYDLVVGNRFAGGIQDGAMPWKNKYIGNPILSLIGRTLFNCPLRDFHCGIRAISKEAFLKLDLRTTGMEFASEMLIKACIKNLRITEVPTTLSKDGRSRPPHLKPWRDGWRHLRFMLLLSPRWLFLIPGALLTTFAGIAYFPLLKGPIIINQVSFDINTLFYSQAFFILGLATLVFGLIIRAFAMREHLLQNHAQITQLIDSPILELGSIAGISLLIFGVLLGFDALAIWGAANFGPLHPGQMLRTISLSTTMIIVGGLIFLLSLVLGFLAIPTKDSRSSELAPDEAI